MCVDDLLDQHPARPAAGAGIAPLGNLLYRRWRIGYDEQLDRRLGNAEAGADEGCFALEFFDQAGSVIGEGKAKGFDAGFQAMGAAGWIGVELGGDLCMELVFVEAVEIGEVTACDSVSQDIGGGDHIPTTVGAKGGGGYNFGAGVDPQGKSDKRAAVKAGGYAFRVCAAVERYITRRIEPPLHFIWIERH